MQDSTTLVIVTFFKVLYLDGLNDVAARVDFYKYIILIYIEHVWKILFG